MLKYLYFFLIGLLSTGRLIADNGINEIQAEKVKESPKVDGLLNDPFWKDISPVFSGNFVQSSPDNGATSEYQTEIYIAYSNESFFVAARMFDDPNKILKELGARDQRGKNTDMFGVAIDTYLNGRNAFYFEVSAAGVQSDTYITPERRDRNWNSVWASAVNIDDEGWTVEIEIPYSAIRFPQKADQSWGINFKRSVRRDREESYWNHIDSSVEGFVNQFGVVRGLNNIKPPLRLSFSPYVSAGVAMDGVNNSTILSYGGGMDLKYGINESFTMDLSLVPDFSQVQSDNEVLNLSAFEVKYDENRPFFTEGTELFSKGNLFYSRRIGQSRGTISEEISNTEEIVSRPDETSLINAVKLSGRTSGGLGIGFFNALTNKNYLTVTDTVTGFNRRVVGDPVTNFNILVLDQNLKNNSTISFINTNVMRGTGGSDANVTGGLLQLNDKSNSYRFNTSGFFNKKFGGIASTDNQGFKYDLGFSKISGKYQYSLYRSVESDTYDINDLGFIRTGNQVNHYMRVSYNIFRPVGIFNRLNFGASAFHQSYFVPKTLNQFKVSANFFALFRNFWHVSGNLGGRPGNQYDRFEPRYEGRVFIRPAQLDGRLSLSSDSRKIISFRAGAGLKKSKTYDQSDFNFSVSPRWRVNNQINFNYNLNYNNKHNSMGYVTKQYDDADKLESIVFGQRNIQTITNVLGANWNFSAKMNLTFRARHYWSKVIYNQFFNLEEEGTLGETTYAGVDDQGWSEHNTNFNTFNIDMVYSWEFAPGSFLNIIWKQSIRESENVLRENYFENFNEVLAAPAINSFSVKLLYFLDYQRLRKQLSGKN